MRNNKFLISAISPLKPSSIWNTKTGEAVSPQELETNINNLVSFVQEETNRLFDEDPRKVILDATSLKGSANSYGRQKGYKSGYSSLPRKVLAKSRVNELVLYKLISETASYAKNTNPNKQYPSFPKTVNLGAIDKQMASLSMEGNVLTLVWKCWDNEYLIDFIIPNYVIKRDIHKYSLPLVQSTKTGYKFIFTIQETTPTLVPSKLTAGLDQGRVEPFVLAVVNEEGNRVAHYMASGRLKALNTKRENILAHKRNIHTKISQHESLKIDTTTLTTEAQRLGNKARVLGHVIAQNTGAEITQKLAKHALNTLNVENLSWAHGAKYGSKWNHSRQQEAITHAIARNGVRVRKVSPKNSSQSCHDCGGKLSHKGRSSRCADCSRVLHRDINAALNTASERHLSKSYPSLVNNRLAGDNPSPTGQVIDLSDHSSNTKLVT